MLNPEISRRQFIKGAATIVGMVVAAEVVNIFASPVVSELLNVKQSPILSKTNESTEIFPTQANLAVAKPQEIPVFTTDLTPTITMEPTPGIITESTLPTSKPSPRSTPKPSQSSEMRWVKYQGPLVVWRGDPTSQNVFLTADDGYNYHNLETIAQTAIDNKFRMSFFLLGDVLKKYPKGLMRDLHNEGFDFENHTKTHAWLDRLSKNKIEYEILTARDELAKAIQADPKQRFVRPPGEYGVTGVSIWLPFLEALRETNYRALVWSWELSSNGSSFGPESATDKQVTKVINNIVNHMVNGGISLQHTINVDTKAFPTIAKRVKARGFRPITVAKGII